jgi:hypothetical protein
VRHATDCGCHQFCGWCLVPVEGVATTAAPGTKTHHSCGAGIRGLTVGAIVVVSVVSHGDATPSERGMLRPCLDAKFFSKFHYVKRRFSITLK